VTVRSPKHGNTSLAIAEALRQAILRGDYAPGERIIQDQLAAKYGGSRIPVREALRTLESEGLVRLVANTGAWVASLTASECSEVYQMRERIEPLLLRFNAPEITHDYILELEDLAQRMENARDVEEFLQLDRQFHLGMYQRVPTYLLGELGTRLWNTTQPYRRAYTMLVDTTNLGIVHSEHHMLVTALRDGDLDLAEQVVALHIRRTRLHLERHPEVFTIPADNIN
jgi:DNA-binding GntR family transcriptional regulator